MTGQKERRKRLARLPTNVDVHAKLTDMTFRRLLPIAVLSMAGMLAGTALTAWIYRDGLLWMLAGMAMLLTMIRCLLIYRLERSAALRMVFNQTKLLRRFYSTTMVLYYCVFNVAMLHNFHLRRRPAEMICTISTLIMCSGLAGRIALAPRLAMGNGLLMLGVLGYSIFDQNDPLSMLASFVILLFGISYCQAIQNKYELVVELIRSQRRLRVLAEEDVLTGLCNRRSFDAELERLLRNGAMFAVLFLDLDGFKAVNDTFGHLTGDEVLKEVARRLESTVRQEDIVARFGGDEFAILQVPVTSPSSAEALAERITRSIAAPFEIEGRTIFIGASIGLVIALNGDETPSDLMKRADEALYRSKDGGRGRHFMGAPAELTVSSIW